MRFSSSSRAQCMVCHHWAARCLARSNLQVIPSLVFVCPFFASFLTSSLLCHHKPQSATCGPTLALVHGNDVSVELYQGPGEIWASQKKLQQWHCNGHSTAAMFRVARSWYSCRSWLRCHPTVKKLKYECSNWPNQHFDELHTSQQIRVLVRDLSLLSLFVVVSLPRIVAKFRRPEFRVRLFVSRDW